MKSLFLIFSLLVIVPKIQLSAAIVISNFNVSATTASFTISGQIDSGPPTPSSFTDSIYIGDPGNLDWITAPSIMLGSVSGTVDGISINDFGTGNSVTSGGDYIVLVGVSPFNFTDGGSISISATVDATYSPQNIDQDNLILTWGV